MSNYDPQLALRQTIAGVLDHPSVYMGGPSRQHLRKADQIIECLRRDPRLMEALRAGMETSPARGEKCFADCGDNCQCEKYPPQYCKGCSNTVDQCTCTAGETSTSPDDDETPCPKRDDGVHCECWYEGEACCSCGAAAMLNGQAHPPCRPDVVCLATTVRGLTLSRCEKYPDCPCGGPPASEGESR